MQTKRQIHQLLTSAGVVPNRKFGQHFLVDLNLLRLVVDSAQIGPHDIVLEVGCGTGSMTEALAERAGRMVAVELDPTLAAIARSQLAQASNVVLVQGDALSSKGSFNPAVIAAIEGSCPIRNDASISKKPSRLLLVSNLPYDVASAVIANLVNGPLVADAMVVTVQKEVAERMVAPPGSRDYGSLSILLGATGDIEILRILKPGVFWPPPQVDSAIVRFVRMTRSGARSKTSRFWARWWGCSWAIDARCSAPAPSTRRRIWGGAISGRGCSSSAESTRRVDPRNSRRPGTSSWQTCAGAAWPSAQRQSETTSIPPEKGRYIRTLWPL